MENHQTELRKEIESNKYLTWVLISVAFIVLGVIFIFIALNQPKVNNDKDYNITTKSSVSDNSIPSDKSNAVKNDNTASSHSVSFPINLNTCTAEDLIEIENVGEARANAIIAYRDFIGGYTSVEQLKNISGIGESVYRSIEPYVTV